VDKQFVDTLVPAPPANQMLQAPPANQKVILSRTMRVTYNNLYNLIYIFTVVKNSCLSKQLNYLENQTVVKHMLQRSIAWLKQRYKKVA